MEVEDFYVALSKFIKNKAKSLPKDSPCVSLLEEVQDVLDDLYDQYEE